MDIETWKSIWHIVLIGSSALFYIVVIAVGIKGVGDVKEMVAQMIANRDSDA
ncbi:MAG: hypothetical protein ACI906_003949 [Candidatus Latescibacterota bacterium]|jgi:hypothetical protein|tara:strand:+ start:145 stop:300 length:156 start_codon:yes stop_codon:yes gene_type:complete